MSESKVKAQIEATLSEFLFAIYKGQEDSIRAQICLEIAPHLSGARAVPDQIKLESGFFSC